MTQEVRRDLPWAVPLSDPSPGLPRLCGADGSGAGAVSARAGPLAACPAAATACHKRLAGGQRAFRDDHYVRGIDEFRARRVADALRDRGINAHLLRGGLGQFGVRVSLPGGREAEWDTDGTAGLEAQVMRDGMLVGYVPQIECSEDFTESQIVDAIARTDYDQPIARQRTLAPATGPPLAREGGVFRRFLDGFRYR